MNRPNQPSKAPGEHRTTKSSPDTATRTGRQPLSRHAGGWTGPQPAPAWKAADDHGAWHGAWAWDSVASRLLSAGARVAAPDLTLGADAGLGGHVEEVVTVLDALPAAGPDRPPRLERPDAVNPILLDFLAAAG